MLRKKQKRVYDWLGRFIQEYGYAPGYGSISSPGTRDFLIFSEIKYLA